VKHSAAIAALLSVFAAPAALAGVAADRIAAFKHTTAAVMFFFYGQDRLSVLAVVPTANSKPETTLGVCNLFAGGLAQFASKIDAQMSIRCENVVGLLDPDAPNTAYVSTIPFSNDKARTEKPAVAVMHATDVNGKHVDADSFEIFRTSDVLPDGIAMTLCLQLAKTEGHKTVSNEAGTVRLKDLYYTCEPDNS
jgi:hypothetical protein